MTYWITFCGCSIRKLGSEFQTLSHCRSINLKSGSKNVARWCINLRSINLKPGSKNVSSWCIDDTHLQFKSKEQSREFQKILNKQDKLIQFTIEDENEEKCLKNFLDIEIKNSNRRYEFEVHRKPVLTNAQIKPHSCIPPDTSTRIFKGFLARSTKIRSEKYLRAEKGYLTDIVCKNGHHRKTLQKIINNSEKKSRSTNNNNDNNSDKNFPFLGYQKSDQK